jgi:hypothetical protein
MAAQPRPNPGMRYQDDRAFQAAVRAAVLQELQDMNQPHPQLQNRQLRPQQQQQ